MSKPVITCYTCQSLSTENVFKKLQYVISSIFVAQNKISDIISQKLPLSPNVLAKREQYVYRIMTQSLEFTSIIRLKCSKQVILSTFMFLCILELYRPYNLFSMYQKE